MKQEDREVWFWFLSEPAGWPGGASGWPIAARAKVQLPQQQTCLSCLPNPSWVNHSSGLPHFKHAANAKQQSFDYIAYTSSCALCIFWYYIRGLRHIYTVVHGIHSFITVEFACTTGQSDFFLYSHSIPTEKKKKCCLVSAVTIAWFCKVHFSNFNIFHRRKCCFCI